MKIGVYPGTFDPITNGHLDIIKRSINLFDKLYIVIPSNMSKTNLFTVEERINLIKLATKEYDNIIVCATPLLTVEFAKQVGASYMIRGLRMVSDFEYELQLSTFNKKLAPEIETLFIMASHEYSFLSSSSVKEIAHFNGDITCFVPDVVEKAIREKYNK